MPKLNYFDSLERLALFSSRAVFIACSPQGYTSRSELVDMRHSADVIICELEKALFSDFMPPLERHNIAACAHSLERILEKSSEILNYHSSKSFFTEEKNKEAEICIRLSASIEKNIFRLRKIKRPEELPDFAGFRDLLTEARSSHNDLERKLSTGAFPPSSHRTLDLYGRLRSELSHCFDDIVEIMLNNI